MFLDKQKQPPYTPPAKKEVLIPTGTGAPRRDCAASLRVHCPLEISNLLLIIIFAGYGNFVSKINTGNHEDRPDWMGHVSFTDLKIKVIGSIIAISGIELLKAFVNVEAYTNQHWVGRSACIWGLCRLGCSVRADGQTHFGKTQR